MLMNSKALWDILWTSGYHWVKPFWKFSHIYEGALSHIEKFQEQCITSMTPATGLSGNTLALRHILVPRAFGSLKVPGCLGTRMLFSARTVLAGAEDITQRPIQSQISHFEMKII